MSTPPGGETAIGWLTPAEARASWADAPKAEGALERVLQVAHELCVAYQAPPEVTETSPLPARFREAQLLQAKAIWQAERAGVGDVIGDDGRTVRVYPMDWNVKNLLRPDDGLPELG